MPGDRDPNPMKLTRFHKQFNLNDAIVRLAEALEIPEQELRDEFNKQKGLR